MNTLPPKAPPKPKIHVANIRICAAEGPMSKVDKTVKTFKEANTFLHEVCNSAPTDGTCHKVDFLITYVDGNEYKGEFAAKHLSQRVEPTDLREHLRLSLTFHAGLHCPAHMTQEKYEKVLADYGHETLAKATKFLTTYALDDPATPPPVEVINYTKSVDMLVASVGGLVRSYENNAAELTEAGRPDDAHKQTRRAFELRKAMTYILKAREIP